MPNLVALGLMVSDEDFQRFQKKLNFVAMATGVFKGIKLFQEIFKGDHGRNISVKFHQNLIGLS